jgi:hypothetical protein
MQEADHFTPAGTKFQTRLPWLRRCEESLVASPLHMFADGRIGIALTERGDSTL